MSDPTASAGATRIRVGSGSPYDVVVGRGVLEELSRMLPGDVRRVAVCHAAELTAYADRIADLMPAGIGVLRLPLPDGESAKSASVAVEAWERLGEAGFTRSDAVVTVGGGATTDMGGFIAATWLRGVAVVHVPTTLLAMVDAAVGGKTGMNTGSGKNLVGSFHEPRGVVCDLALLDTLPHAELVAGLGEVIKCGFISDPRILERVEADPAGVLNPASAVLRELIERAIQVKADIVARDLRETGGRSGHPGREALNYGHTLAHAIEKATDYGVRHGEAVSLGMVYVAELARVTGRLDEAAVSRHERVLSSVGLPIRFGTVAFETLLAAMRVDKKARGDQLRFIVLEDLARPVVLAGPGEEDLRAAYARVAGTSGADRSTSQEPPSVQEHP